MEEKSAQIQRSPSTMPKPQLFFIENPSLCIQFYTIPIEKQINKHKISKHRHKKFGILFPRSSLYYMGHNNQTSASKRKLNLPGTTFPS